MEDINQRFRISDTPMSGTIEEIGELTQYKSGNGFFRNIVMSLPGGIAPVLLPITVFGTDAADLDPTLDLHRDIKCTARLTSRRYLDKSGNVRWILSMSAVAPMLGPRKGEEPQAESHDFPPEADEAVENLPF